MDPSIFKAYDVRGLYGDQLDEDLAYAIGRAFARVLAGKYDSADHRPRARRWAATCA